MAQVGAGLERPSLSADATNTASRWFTLARYPNNLPLQLNRFIGRERAIDEIKRTLWSTRLLTLTGPGGCGKTRLALKVAEELNDAFGDGVWLIELASLSDATLIVRTMMTALDMHEQTGRTPAEALIEQLQPRELLLVLDNCEHLIDGCAELAMTLLQHCSGLRILATSREVLNIAGEIAWPVPPLSTIDPQRSVDAAALQTSEAACLFLDRATAAQADFAVSDQAATAIAQICRRLDGMPLAFELAASRVKVLKTAEIAARLDDRLNSLTAGSRTALPRHQTLRAAIDWSYDLLNEAIARGQAHPLITGGAAPAGYLVDPAPWPDIIADGIQRGEIALDDATPGHALPVSADSVFGARQPVAGR